MVHRQWTNQRRTHHREDKSKSFYFNFLFTFLIHFIFDLESTEKELKDSYNERRMNHESEAIRKMRKDPKFLPDQPKVGDLVPSVCNQITAKPSNSIVDVINHLKSSYGGG